MPDDYGQLDELPDELGGRGRRGGRSQGPLDQIRDYCGPHGCYPCSRCTTRFQLAILSSVGFCISFGIRCNMGLAVLQMTSNATRWTLAPIVKSIHPNLTIAMVRRIYSFDWTQIFKPFYRTFPATMICPINIPGGPRK